MEEEPQPQHRLHVAMFPWLAFGHFIPYLELAALIARKGHRVSFISTPRNIQRLLLNTLSSLVDFVSFPLHHENLPETMESTMDCPPDKFPFLMLAYDALKPHLSAFLQSANPDWIIYDVSGHWIPEVAAKHGVPLAFFFVCPFSTLGFMGSCTTLMEGRDPRAGSPEKFTVAPDWVPFPSTVAYRLHEARQIAGLYEKGGLNKGLGAVVHGCDLCLSRGTYEVDGQWISVCREIHQRPMLPLGPMPTPAQDGSDDAWPDIEPWLEHQARGSVVYVAFGSEVPLSGSEVEELAEGLALSGSPFLWALRKQSSELPDGFEDRVKGRGVVWRGWAPQLRILGHASVGGFLTHCGPSSVKEALQLGQPLIMLPIFMDQPLIARVMRDELKVGVEIERDESDGSFVRESVAESVRSVMRGEERRRYKEKAMEMKKIYGNEELQEKYTNDLVEYLQQHRRRCGPTAGASSRQGGEADEQARGPHMT